MFRIINHPNEYTDGYHFRVQKRLWILPIWITETELVVTQTHGYENPRKFSTYADAINYIKKECARIKKDKELSRRKTRVVEVIPCQSVT